VKISPAGDKLTLEPSSIPLGNVKNPNAKFHAVIYATGIPQIRAIRKMPDSRARGRVEIVLLHHRWHGRRGAEKGEEKKPDKKSRREEGSMLESLAKTWNRCWAARQRPNPAIGSLSSWARRPVPTKRLRSSREKRSRCPSAPVQTDSDGRFSRGRRESASAVAWHDAGRLGRRNLHGNDCQRQQPFQAKITITDAKGKVSNRAISSMAEVSPAVLVASTI